VHLCGWVVLYLLDLRNNYYLIQKLAQEEWMVAKARGRKGGRPQIFNSDPAEQVTKNINK
jgi:hypothetical protein